MADCKSTLGTVLQVSQCVTLGVLHACFVLGISDQSAHFLFRCQTEMWNVAAESRVVTSAPWRCETATSKALRSLQRGVCFAVPPDGASFPF